MLDDLSSLKDDMIAFIEGHGMRRFAGYVSEEVSSVMWKAKHADSWKDFVELAKAAGAPFLTMDDAVLQPDELERLTDRLRNANYPDDADIEEARMLRAYTDKTGFIQLGWAHQGIVFLFETSTDWYDRYQRLVDIGEEFGGFVIDEHDDDEPF
jgi:hypothetical protein